jgi:hypothetical protein
MFPRAALARHFAGTGRRVEPVRTKGNEMKHFGDAAQRFLDAGLDGLIFNMPTGSTPEDVALAGRTERFGADA